MILTVPAQTFWGSPHPSHGLNPHTSPPDPPAPAPATPQHGWSPSPHSTALPGHWPHQAGPTCGPMSWPCLGQSPVRCPMSRAGASPVCPSCPAPAWGMGWALAGRHWRVPQFPAPRQCPAHAASSQ